MWNARFYFDTGAGLCLLLSSDFVSDSSVLDPKHKTYMTQAQGLGGKANMRLTVVKELRVGPYRFRKVPTYIFDDDYNVTSYPNLGGLLGNDILRRFNVTLNYDKREIFLLPNTHYRDQFDYSYTGLSIYWVEGEIRIGDVMPESPAEKAGLKADDVLIAVTIILTIISKSIRISSNRSVTRSRSSSRGAGSCTNSPCGFIVFFDFSLPCIPFIRNL